MKILKYVIAFCVVPFTLQAALQDDLVRLKKSLLTLSQVLGSTKKRPLPTPPPEKPIGGYIPAGKPTKFSDIQQWLLDAIGIYKKDPFDFAKNIQESELATLKNMLISYFTQAAKTADDDEGDINVESDILGFVRITLEKKRVGPVNTQYGALNTAINKNYYENVEKYSKDYISEISKDDFKKALTDFQANVSTLVAQIPNLQNKKPTELVTAYQNMQQALQDADILMLPITAGDIKKVYDEVQELQVLFKDVMQNAQQALTQKYNELQDDEEIKKIRQDYQQSKIQAQKGKDPQTALQALEISTKTKIDKRINSLIYRDFLMTERDFDKMLEDCQNIQAIAEATSKDRDKLIVLDNPKAVCSSIHNIGFIRDLSKKLVEWSNAATVNNYSKADAQQAYFQIVGSSERIKKILGTIPAGTQSSIETAQTVVLDRLNTFKNEYEAAITQEKEAIARAVSAGDKPTYHDMMAATNVKDSCAIAEAIYKHKKTSMPQSIAGLCEAVKQIIAGQGSPNK